MASAILDLQTSRVALDQAGQLGDAGDPSVGVGDVGDVGPADEGDQVVLAERREGDVSHHHHLVVIGCEGDGQMAPRVVRQAGKELLVHGGHPGRGIDQAVTGRIFAYGVEDLGHRPLDALEVHCHVCGQLLEGSGR
jgi:hypothetical protein